MKAYTIPISSSVGIRVYADTQPHNWKISDLQKGLVLVCEGEETIGEGTGFGLPVLVYSNETCFSGTSRLYVSRDCWTVKKEFIMNRIARNKYRNVTLENRKARNLIAFLARLYQLHPKLRFLALKGLTRNFDINTTFVATEPAGKVTVTYVIDKKNISVSADFRHITDEGLVCVFMLNEQGSRIYRRYVDSQGTELIDQKIGAWNGINVEWATLSALESELGFRLWRKKSSILRRGREFLQGSLDWVGLDYEIPPGNSVFEYPIEILGCKQG